MFRKSGRGGVEMFRKLNRFEKGKQRNEFQNRDCDWQRVRPMIREVTPLHPNRNRPIRRMSEDTSLEGELGEEHHVQ